MFARRQSRTFPGLLALLVLAATSAPASAQSPSNEAVRAVLGTWEISNADRDRTCTVTFKDENVRGGLKLELDQPCAANFPRMKDVIAWGIGTNDALRLLDRQGKAVLEFTEVESGMYEAEQPGEGIYFMQTPADAAGPPEQTADQMLGTWSLAREAGKPICTLTLTNTARGNDLLLELKPGCDESITRFGPFTWAMDRGELLLKSARGLTWRFEEADSATWQRVPESVNPLRLTRQP
ncbi:MAG TPA: AprI/Inh family metalloprotease inhibitor [Xanthobacteraceae bacterium]|nr:AprI/Inh family metalloprotease inhibitor [Xanthobacteraceae bacterium]